MRSPSNICHSNWFRAYLCLFHHHGMLRDHFCFLPAEKWKLASVSIRQMEVKVVIQMLSDFGWPLIWTSKLFFIDRVQRERWPGDQKIREHKVGVRRSCTSYVLYLASLLRRTASYILFAGRQWDKANRKLSYNWTMSTVSQSSNFVQREHRYLKRTRWSWNW